MKHNSSEFVIRTKKPAQYFRGRIFKGYSPYDDKAMWNVECLSAAGGGRKVSILSLIHYTSTCKKMLITRLQVFARRQRYIFSFDKRLF